MFWDEGLVKMEAETESRKRPKIVLESTGHNHLQKVVGKQNNTSHDSGSEVGQCDGKSAALNRNTLTFLVQVSTAGL